MGGCQILNSSESLGCTCTNEIVILQSVRRRREVDAWRPDQKGAIYFHQVALVHRK